MNQVAASDPTAETQDVLNHIYGMRTDAIEAFYRGKAIGRAAMNLSRDLQHDVGFIQRSLQRNVVLNVLHFMEPNNRYVQNTFSYAIAAMPNDPAAWSGLHYARKALRLRNPTVESVRKALEARVSRRRESPAYEALKIIRDKILAHSERFDPAIMKPITWIQILSLLKFHDKMQVLMYQICCSKAFMISRWPIRSGKSLADLLRKHGSRPPKPLL